MIIDRALKDFTEKYDAEAMRSIEQISRSLGMNENMIKFPSFNIKEAFDQFDTYLRGYGAYKVQYLDNPSASDQSAIKESTDRFLEQVIKPCTMLYKQMPTFIKEYVNGVDMLHKTVSDVKESMIDEGVDLNAVGDVNEFTDKFMERVDDAFYPIVERMLDASGYNSNKRLEKMIHSPTPRPQKQTVVFL